MALPARPRFFDATHIPHSVRVKIFIAVIAADQDGEQQRMLCLATPHQATVNLLTVCLSCVIFLSYARFSTRLCQAFALGARHTASQKKVSNAGGSEKDANGDRKEKSDLNPSV